MKKLAIIGAGPIGLEAALVASGRGYDVRVFERGAVADSVQRWGHVRMFSPFGMNASEEGLKRVRNRGRQVPDPSAFLTGSEFAEAYLQPLAESLDRVIELHAEVVALAREQVRKTDRIGEPERGDTPLRLMLRRGEEEWFVNADVVFDCSGTFGSPNPLGDGGIPALGERAAGASISYGMPDVLPYAEQRVLVVGNGHSAATAVRELARLPGTEISWAVRRAVSEPCLRVADDPLEERDRLSSEANAFARKIRFLPGTTVHGVERNGSGLKVTLTRGQEQQTLVVDHVIAATGFRPDLSLARELQVQTCWATEGTYKLAASLLGETGGDCLAVSGFGAETLLHPEPGYFTLGMKSYGRSPDFLIRTGREQITSVLDWLERNPLR